MKSICYVFLLFFIFSCNANKTSFVPENDSVSINEVMENDSIPIIDYNSYVKQLDVVRMVVRDSFFSEFFYKCISDNLKKGRINNRNYYPESIVLGHLEEDTIVGNFDGLGIDTLFVEPYCCACKDFPLCEHVEYDDKIKYYLVSKSGRLPHIRLLAADCNPPRIVNEGDLDGDGQSEIGYMYTWMTSQWRNYRVLTFYKNEWRYLIDPQEEYMSTSRLFRLSGYEIVEKGKKKGTLLVHFLPEGLNQSVHDTIIKPSYVKIDDIEK